MSAADLVEATGLSRPTVISILNDLESSGWVIRGASDPGGLGRPATTWSLGGDVGIVIGADILVDSMLMVAVTFGGTIMAARSSRLSQYRPDARLEAVVSAIESLRDACRDKGPLLHLAVSTTGVVDGEGRVVRSDLVPQWTGLNLGHLLSQRVDVPVTVDNDINMAAYGEFCQRRQRGALDPDADMLLVRMSRGLHTGLVLNGQLHRGRTWNAGEISDVLDLRLDGDETPDDDWIDRAALTTGSVAAVIDPDVIVMSGPTNASVTVIRRIIERLISRRPLGSESMTAEVEELGRAASVVGTLNTALEVVTRKALGTEHPHPVALRDMAKVVSAVEKGQHSVMTTHREERLGDHMRVGVVGVGARCRLALNAEMEGNEGVVTAVCEPHHLARKRVAERLGKDPDSITITSDVAGLIASGGLALTLATPAWAAAQTDLCTPGASFTLTSAEGVDPALVTSVREALTARGLSVAADDAALTAVIAVGGSILAIATIVGSVLGWKAWRRRRRRSPGGPGRTGAIPGSTQGRRASS